MTGPDPLTPAELQALVGQVARDGAEDRVRGCAAPVRLHGSTTTYDSATGEVLSSYGSADELDGTTYVRCGNRRAAVCPSCSREYKGDAWHLLVCGLAGGKGVPETVATHPTVFVTLTAPSFGPVHGRRGDSKPCRARRDRPTCPHGRPAWCLHRHTEEDPRLGTPLCFDCYAYDAHVLWQWHAPELWRRFSIALGRNLAQRAGLSGKAFKARCRVAYTKVVEFQARGAVHVHAPIRLDGPDGPDSPPWVDLDADDLTAAVREAASHVTLVVADLDGQGLALRWGTQLDVQPITPAADRDGHCGEGGPAHPLKVAAYLAKYLTKATEDFGLPRRVLSAAHAASAGASRHAVRLIETAEQLAEQPHYGRLLACLATLGYRGHPVTKSRCYSVTFGALREARKLWRRRPPGLDPNATVRELPADDDPDAAASEAVTVVSAWTFSGLGYLDLDTAARAVRSAMLARTR